LKFRNPSEPLRVMVLTTVPITLAAFFEKQLRNLAEDGLEVHAVSSPGPVFDRLDAGPLVMRHGVPMERQPNPWLDAQSLVLLLMLMRKVRPHVVHAHTPKAGLLGMLAAKLAGIPVRLYTVHGLPLETRTGLLRRVLEMAERASARCSTRTYAVSPSVRSRVVELGLCPEDKVSILGDGSCSGVDVDRFRIADGPEQRRAVRTALAIPEDAPLATYIGRLSRDKGIEVLAAAWPALSRQVPSLHLLMAGEPDATDPVSAEAMQVLQNDPKIHLIGNVSPSAIPGLYAASDLTVLPTFREGLSQVALESGAMGVPIVSTRVCGLDSVIDGVTGILVPPRDSQALADAMARLASDASLRSSLGQAARARISSHYSEQRVNQLWMTEYRRLVRESFPGAPPKTTVELKS
jgi:glycosyltransferase involved in cell wall biosynthesis